MDDLSLEEVFPKEFFSFFSLTGSLQAVPAHPVSGVSLSHVLSPVCLILSMSFVAVHVYCILFSRLFWGVFWYLPVVSVSCFSCVFRLSLFPSLSSCGSCVLFTSSVSSFRVCIFSLSRASSSLVSCLSCLCLSHQPTVSLYSSQMH